ncbi:MAG: T9SS type A sorting domain-containing protein [Flavobacteriales bacterium]|nr:T9SS type A sorting domain-containing protein [Flavobacteriales bacterium]
MKTRQKLLMLLMLLQSAAFAQRVVDAIPVILSPPEGYTFRSPSVERIKVGIINLGTDTIKNHDGFSMKFKFGGVNPSPKFETFGRWVSPGDTFIYEQDIKVNWVGNVDSSPMCAEVTIFNWNRGQSDSLVIETGKEKENNKVCQNTNHRDSTSKVGILGEELTNQIIFPNPVNGNFIHFKREVSSVKVLDFLGKEVINYREELGLGLNKIEIANLPNGVYFVMYQMGVKSYTSKIIVNR